MARPKKEGLEYFPHDTDSVNDEKVEALRMLYGNDGYAFYFILLERIYRTKNAELDVSDAETIQILSKKVDVTIEKFGIMLETALKRDCFDKEQYEERGVLTSNGIKKRVMPVLEKRESMRNKYALDKKDDSLLVSGAETKKEPDKVKHSKVKHSKAIKTKYADFVSMTSDEHEKLVSQFGDVGTNERIENLNIYKGSTGKKYASDYMTILAWERKNGKTEKANDAPKYKPFQLNLEE